MAYGQMYEIAQIAKLNQQELDAGMFDLRKSWHNEFKNSSYIFIGGLDDRLSEGDIVTAFSQFGDIVDAHLVR